MSEPRYLEQLARVERWYVRFSEVANGKPKLSEQSIHRLEDDVYTFFQNCYHLKDWIMNDATVDISVKREINNTINNSRYLSVCADICNGLKHLELNNPRFPPKSGSQPKLADREISIYPNVEQGSFSEAATFSLGYKVSTNYGEMDLFDLATKCMDEWRRFVADKIK